jgi:hypothetical protein
VVDHNDVKACPPEQLLDFIQTYHGVFNANAVAGAVHKTAQNRSTMGSKGILAHPAMPLLFQSVVQLAPQMFPDSVAHTLTAGADTRPLSSST